MTLTTESDSMRKQAHIVITHHGLPKTGETSWTAILHGQRFWAGQGTWSRDEVGDLICQAFELVTGWTEVTYEYTSTRGWRFFGKEPEVHAPEPAGGIHDILREIEEELANGC